jgi:hypothetical protein
MKPGAFKLWDGSQLAPPHHGQPGYPRVPQPHPVRPHLLAALVLQPRHAPPSLGVAVQVEFESNFFSGNYISVQACWVTRRFQAMGPTGFNVSSPTSSMRSSSPASLGLWSCVSATTSMRPPASRASTARLSPHQTVAAHKLTPHLEANFEKPGDHT